MNSLSIPNQRKEGKTCRASAKIYFAAPATRFRKGRVTGGNDSNGEEGLHRRVRWSPLASFRSLPRSRLSRCRSAFENAPFSAPPSSLKVMRRSSSPGVRVLLSTARPKKCRRREARSKDSSADSEELVSRGSSDRGAYSGDLASRAAHSKVERRTLRAMANAR